jgi:hypothetical protein
VKSTGWQWSDLAPWLQHGAPMTRVCLVFALAACASEPGPINYSGETRRFVVDSIAVPKNNSEARAFGLDIDQDRTVDNQLGMVIGTLNSFGNITKHPDDMIASGVIASSVELVANDFASDSTVALRYIGSDGDTADLIGGELHAGAFTTALSGGGAVHLPVFVDADPVILPLVHMRAALVPDGRGGYDATIAGAVPEAVAKTVAFEGVMEMFASRPGDHIVFHRMLDTQPLDYAITQQEFEQNNLVRSLMSPDLQIDGAELLSIGFHAHLSPCPQGRCVAAPPAPTCFDRVRNGAEADIDCGGSCGACASGARCGQAADCQSATCNGTCAAPSCSNGVRDGLETDVDCGSQCGGCAVNAACVSNRDCTSGQCGPPCSGGFCGDYSFDTCR